MGSSLPETFLTRSHQAPERPVLDFEQRRFTAGQLARDVSAFASALVPHPIEAIASTEHV